MKNRQDTIRKFVGYLNNPEQEGGFWLPNIQRPFVWREGQICRLYDSILREYPIGSLLVWKTDSQVKRRKFIDIYHDRIDLTKFYVPEDDKPKMLVLDGQQRLQSLIIGLKGSYNTKELCFNLLSGDLTAPEDIKYEFNFMDPKLASFPWVRFKDIVFSDKRTRQHKEELLSKTDQQLSDKDLDRLEDNLELVRDVFCTQENIIYQEINSIDRSETYQEDDIVEIFIRANSGGTTLNKSDLMFSLLIASWDEAEEQMVELLHSLNKTGYYFSRDFILKTCLVLLNKGAKYNVNKFRDETTKNEILEQWDEIVDAVKVVKDYVYGNTFMKTHKNVGSYLSLIPLIYFRYHNKDKWNNHLSSYQKYLTRVSLTGAFSGQSDSLLDRLVRLAREQQDFDLNEVFGSIRASGRSLDISKDLIVNLEYGKRELHLLFNLWYGFNYQPSYEGNMPQVDHIFPQSELRKLKVQNPNSGQWNIMRYKKWERNQIANLMLLTADENGAGGKSNIMPAQWFENKPEDYLDLHLIPRDPKLWKLENYEQFVIERRKLILEKFDYLIYQERSITNDQ